MGPFQIVPAAPPLTRSQNRSGFAFADQKPELATVASSAFLWFLVSGFWFPESKSKKTEGRDIVPAFGQCPCPVVSQVSAPLIIQHLNA